MADYSGASYSDFFPREPTVEELERQVRVAKLKELFPNVGFGPNEDRTVREYALRRKSDGKIVTKLEEIYEFGPMGHCPEGYEVVGRTLYPEPWEKLNV